MLHFHFLAVPAAHELIPWFQDVLWFRIQGLVSFYCS
jgi:hypothetical protein